MAYGYMGIGVSYSALGNFDEALLNYEKGINNSLYFI